MPFLANLLQRWTRRRPATAASQIEVVFDETAVSIRVDAGADPSWNDAFSWTDVRRVCFTDGGLFSSDMVYVTLGDRDRVVTIPTEARGGSTFFGAVCDRGLLPEAVWRRAVGDTSGGTHCWPPHDESGKGELA